MTTSPTSQLGFRRKSLLEKAKLLALFLLLGALIWVSRPTPQLFAAGFVLVSIGAGLRVWAAGHLNRDLELVTSGPYAHVRHPFYLGRLMLLLGFGLMSGLGNNWARLIFVAAILIFFAFYLPRKERREGGRLREMFGADYERWRQNVPLLLPRLAPFAMNPRPWSRELFSGGDGIRRGNKEAPTTIGIFVLTALFLLRMMTR